jgi:hypothetical protein
MPMNKNNPDADEWDLIDSVHQSKTMKIKDEKDDDIYYFPSNQPKLPKPDSFQEVNVVDETNMTPTTTAMNLPHNRERF